ncbi:hypothetical protein RFI_00892 [Reticulomyxa filosa]|uniref:Uncharacterized protein n=1 Tax=Reticulomyxa filosa TaxID=46433 RepID=X6PCC1_RETFI|nr:hypothetical protein RFI_00892 [Reticulomyxa filosa]|eukprot:ETO36170.1 hypothetical protein RFI_00892 [Reticulomyxa filosa]
MLNYVKHSRINYNNIESLIEAKGKHKMVKNKNLKKFTSKIFKDKVQFSKKKGTIKSVVMQHMFDYAFLKNFQKQYEKIIIKSVLYLKNYVLFFIEKIDHFHKSFLCNMLYMMRSRQIFYKKIYIEYTFDLTVCKFVDHLILSLVFMRREYAKLDAQLVILIL